MRKTQPSRNLREEYSRKSREQTTWTQDWEKSDGLEEHRKDGMTAAWQATGTVAWEEAQEALPKATGSCGPCKGLALFPLNIVNHCKIFKPFYNGHSGCHMRMNYVRQE